MLFEFVLNRLGLMKCGCIYNQENLFIFLCCKFSEVIVNPLGEKRLIVVCGIIEYYIDVVRVEMLFLFVDLTTFLGGFPMKNDSWYYPLDPICKDI